MGEKGLERGNGQMMDEVGEGGNKRSEEVGGHMRVIFSQRRGVWWGERMVGEVRWLDR